MDSIIIFWYKHIVYLDDILSLSLPLPPSPSPSSSLVYSSTTLTLSPPKTQKIMYKFQVN